MSCLRKCLGITNVQAQTDRLFEIKRMRTDVYFLSLMAILMMVFLGLVIYCTYYGDIARMTNGHDSCGNICGKKNSLKYNKNTNCSSMDHTKNKFLIVIGKPNNLTKQCVPDCAQLGCNPVYRICVCPNNTLPWDESGHFLEGKIGHFHRYWRWILSICFIALALSVAVLMLLGFFPAFTVWFILLATIAALCLLTYTFWKVWELSENPVFRGVAIGFLSGAVAIFLYIVRMRIRIQLGIQFFRESGIALTSMPLLLMRPLLTFLCIATVFCIWIYFALWIESSGKLTKRAPNMYHYEKDTFMLIARWYNIAVAFWMIQFAISCQHVVIGGAVSAWYFTRDKSKLKCPVFISSCNLVRYHLGSAAMGSFIITLMIVVHIILLFVEASSSIMEKKDEGKFKLLEKISKYLGSNVYAEIALRGYSFIAASKWTFKITKEHISQVQMISAVADIVMLCGQCLVGLCVLLIGFLFLQDMEHPWDFVILAVLLIFFSFCAARCFTTAYKMTVDTLFLCFCEDCEINDGVVRPYYMNRALKEFVETSKRILSHKDSSPSKFDSYIAQASEFLKETLLEEQK